MAKDKASQLRVRSSRTQSEQRGPPRASLRWIERGERILEVIMAEEGRDGLREEREEKRHRVGYGYNGRPAGVALRRGSEDVRVNEE